MMIIYMYICLCNMGFGGCSFYPPNPRPKKLVTFMEDVVSSTAAANLTSRPHGGGSETPDGASRCNERGDPGRS